MSINSSIGGVLPTQLVMKIENGQAELLVDEHLEPKYAELLEGKTRDELLELVSDRLRPDSGYKWLVVERRVGRDYDHVVLTTRTARSASGRSESLGRLESTASILEEMVPGIEPLREDARAEMEQAACTHCKANEIMRKYVRRVGTLVKAGGHSLDLEVLKDRLDSADFLQLVSGDPASSGNVHPLFFQREVRNPSVGIPPNYGGPRPSCLDCCRKHLGKAISQLGEAELGYPHHFWLAMANLSEMEEESLAEYPDFAAMVREVRIEMTENREYKPSLMEMFDMIDELGGTTAEPEIDEDENIEIL